MYFALLLSISVKLTCVKSSVISVVSSNGDNAINKEEGVLEIFRLSVDSKMRGRGVALKLVDKVLQVIMIMMRVRMVMMREGIKMIMTMVRMVMMRD